MTRTTTTSPKLALIMNYKEPFKGKSRDCIAKTIRKCSDYMQDFEGNTLSINVHITRESMNLVGETEMIEGFVEFTAKARVGS